MRVVLQEEIVQVFGDEGRHAGIRQGWCEKKHPKKLEVESIFRGKKQRFLPSLLKFKYRNGAQSESKPERKHRDVMWHEHHLVPSHVYCGERKWSKTSNRFIQQDGGDARPTWLTDPASRRGRDGRPPRLSTRAWTWRDHGGRTAARHTGGSVGCPPRSVSIANTKPPLKSLIHRDPLDRCCWTLHLSVCGYGSVLVDALIFGLNVSLWRVQQSIKNWVKGHFINSAQDYNSPVPRCRAARPKPALEPEEVCRLWPLSRLSSSCKDRPDDVDTESIAYHKTAT